ncbi:cytochrome P450 9e2-like [Cephus cinctus]|uniref:Cytochrome P450 9e2-like n=1 Tax=Cephus cinctus TaxID=211228 RepID=A0AAJ7FNA9_CEPCN|nr:cytochrome P450 9e2-like [Cephus cinctus]
MNYILELSFGAAIILVLLIRAKIKKYNYFKERGVPTLSIYAGLTNTWKLFTKKISFPDMVMDLYNAHPNAKYIGIFDQGSPVFIIRDPEVVKLVTVKNFTVFLDHKGFVKEEVDPLLGGGLFNMKGGKWKEMRAVISPTFTTSKMKCMFELMSKCGQDFVEFLEKEKQPLVLEMKDVFTRYANDVIATTAFGVTVNSIHDKENEFYMMGVEATSFTPLRSFKTILFQWYPKIMKFLKFKIVSDKVSNFFRDIVITTINTRKVQNIHRPDLLNILMHARMKDPDRELTHDEIICQAFLFFFAGFETVASVMSFVAYHLAIYPEVQEKLRKEVDGVCGRENGQLIYEELGEMKYMEMVLNETMRLIPPSVLTDRVAVEDFHLPANDEKSPPIHIEKGTAIWIPIAGFQKDPKYFAEPEKFDPERFDSDHKNNILPFTFIPFGVGPRSCPANRFAFMEIKLILINILKRFVIKPCEKTSIPMKFAKGTITVVAEKGIWLSFKPRKNIE